MGPDDAARLFVETVLQHAVLVLDARQPPLAPPALRFIRYSAHAALRAFVQRSLVWAEDPRVAKQLWQVLADAIRELGQIRGMCAFKDFCKAAERFGCKLPVGPGALKYLEQRVVAKMVADGHQILPAPNAPRPEPP